MLADRTWKDQRVCEICGCARCICRPRPTNSPALRDVERLKQYLQHKTTCDAARTSSACPACGSDTQHYEKAIACCNNCGKWFPAGKQRLCTCGLNSLLSALANSGTTSPIVFTDDEWCDIEVAVMRAPAFGAHTRQEQERLINKIRRARASKVK